MKPPNTSGIVDVYVIRWDNAAKDGWGVQIDYANGGYRMDFIGSEGEATDAMLAELKTLDN